MVSSKDLPPRTGSFVSMFIKNQYRTHIPIPTRKDANLDGKVAIVTGSNSGLGLECSKQMLSLGLTHLIMAVRSLEGGERAASQLRRAYPQSTIDVWPLVMDDYQSVTDFVNRCDSQLSKIDTVILNAGIFPAKFEKSTSTGHAMGVQVNYLSTVLLVLLLMPVLKAKAKAQSSASEPTHITVVSSVMATLAKFPNRNKRPLLTSFDDTKITPFDPTETYGVSKLLGQFFLVKLASEFVDPDRDRIVINMVDPGFTKGTRLGSEAGVLINAAGAVFKALAARSVTKGAATYIDAAVIKGKESHGSLLLNCNIAPLADIAYTADGQTITNQLWEETMDELDFVQARSVLESFGAS